MKVLNGITLKVYERLNKSGAWGITIAVGLLASDYWKVIDLNALNTPLAKPQTYLWIYLIANAGIANLFYHVYKWKSMDTEKKCLKCNSSLEVVKQYYCKECDKKYD